MDVAYISAVAALAGSVVGGCSSTVTTWITQRAQARSVYIASEVTRRQDLYRDFICTASKTYGDALLSSDPQLQDIVTLYSMISRMRILSAPATIEHADKIMLTIIETFSAPNRSVRELSELIKSGGAGVDLLREFSEAARLEVRAYSTL